MLDTLSEYYMGYLQLHTTRYHMQVMTIRLITGPYVCSSRPVDESTVEGFNASPHIIRLIIHRVRPNTASITKPNLYWGWPISKATMGHDLQADVLAAWRAHGK
jgi:hypothetical protein